MKIRTLLAALVLAVLRIGVQMPSGFTSRAAAASG